MNLEPTEDNPNLPIVKISWIVHNREYEIGILKFFETMKIKITEEEVLKAVREILSRQ